MLLSHSNQANSTKQREPRWGVLAAVMEAFGAFVRNVMLKLLLATGLASLCVGMAQAAPAPAGASIRNVATATYIPNGYAQSETVQSNAVLLNVQAVEALTLTQSQNVIRGPSIPVTLSHLLTNTGNTVSSYTFNLSNNGAGCAADTTDLSNLRMVRDSNNNGVVDPGEPFITLGAAGALTLQPGEVVALLVQGTTPSLGTGSACLAVVATTVLQAVTATNNDIVTLGNNAVLSLTKSASYSGQIIPGISDIAFTINGASVGAQDVRSSHTAAPLGTPITVNGAPMALVLIRDNIPAGTAYNPNTLQSLAAGAIKLYRVAGDAAFAYRSGDGGPSAIEVAIGLPGPVVRNGAVSMSFSVRVAQLVSGNIVNNSQGYYNDGTTAVQAQSNTVVIATTPTVIGLAKAAGLLRSNANGAGSPAARAESRIDSPVNSIRRVRPSSVTDICCPAASSCNAASSAACAPDGRPAVKRSMWIRSCPILRTTSTASAASIIGPGPQMNHASTLPGSTTSRSTASPQRAASSMPLNSSISPSSSARKWNSSSRPM